jgi:hypothetical protein
MHALLDAGFGDVARRPAMVTSGANTATAPARQTDGDEVEFDFDSDAGDIAAGATAIAADFIQGSPPR